MIISGREEFRPLIKFDQDVSEAYKQFNRAFVNCVYGADLPILEVNPEDQDLLKEFIFRIIFNSNFTFKGVEFKGNPKIPHGVLRVRSNINDIHPSQIINYDFDLLEFKHCLNQEEK